MNGLGSRWRAEKDLDDVGAPYDLAVDVFGVAPRRG